MSLKRAIYLFTILLVFSRCEDPIPLDPGTDTGTLTSAYPTEFLFANGLGQLRLLNIGIDGVDTVYQIEPFGNIGSTASYYGGADLTWYNAYDISKKTTSDSSIRIISVLNKMNTKDQAYNKWFQRQFVTINANKRTQLLEYESFLNNKYQELEQWNYPLNGDRAVKFINNTSFLVLFADRWEKKGNEEKPFDVPYSGKVLHLIRYSFNAAIPERGEIITTFSLGDTRVDVYKDKPTKEGTNHLHASAKGNFYIVWAPHFQELAYSPYIIRTDGSMAFNPGLVSFTWTGRYFGQSMFAFEPHSTKDSVFVIGDIAQRQVKLVELPASLGERFIELKTKSIEQLVPGSNTVAWDLFQRQRSWFMTMNKAGTKLAISHSLPGVSPVLTIWA